MLDRNMQLRQLTGEYDAGVADLIRTNLKAHHLDIPGTVYFDDGLDHISDFYDGPSFLLRNRNGSQRFMFRWLQQVPSQILALLMVC